LIRTATGSSSARLHRSSLDNTFSQKNPEDSSQATVYEDLDFAGEIRGDFPGFTSIEKNSFDICSKNSKFSNCCDIPGSPHWVQLDEFCIGFRNTRKETIIVPIYKQLDTTDCSSNYRVISLLSTTYNILSNILLPKLTPYIDEITARETQPGF
jgi:hypothetical protein